MKKYDQWIFSVFYLLDAFNKNFCVLTTKENNLKSSAAS